ncbi:unannotated protein [freshwater metagenome]|uniref:Unannotated protein n=1 Tax=freshwater metagenome TaxID=449393 RepID=A0A6J7INE2_9ZZZZ
MGLKDRILGRRADSSTIAPDAAEPVPSDITILQPGAAVIAPAPQDTMILPAGQEPPTAAVPTAGHEAADAHPGDPLPYPPAPAASPGFRERARMRRRLRHLREVRELGFRDLGGLVFDQHRFQHPSEALVEGKVAAIDAVDRELRMLEEALADRRPLEELYRAGISACARCGTLHDSAANFCPSCGLPFSGLRPVAGMGAPELPPADGATTA